MEGAPPPSGEAVRPPLIEWLAGRVNHRRALTFVMIAYAGILIAAALVAFSSTNAARARPAGGLRAPARETFGSCYGSVAPANTGAAVLIMLGAPTFGVLSVVGMTAVGASVGKAAGAGHAAGLAPSFLFAGLAPHGVFEITGFYIAGIAGLSFARGIVALLAWRRDQARLAMLSFLRQSLMAEAMIVFAGAVECSVTPSLLRSLHHS